MNGVPGAAAWTRQSIARTSQLPSAIVERSPTGAVRPMIGIGMTAIGMSQPTVAR